MMFKKIKAISACILAAAITVGPYASMDTVHAQYRMEVTNYCLNLSEKQVDDICRIVKENITSSYADVYSFDNFELLFSNETGQDNYMSVNVEAVADMTQIRNPKDSPYMQGMAAAIEEITDTEEKAAAVQKYNDHLQEVIPYYQKPIATGFLYQVHLPYIDSSNKSTGNKYELFYLVDAENGDILTPAKEHEEFQELHDEEDGRQYIERNTDEEADQQIARTVSYSKSAAVRYAKNNATEVPEYSAENGMGSDCANFVSKCINAGGIPEDTAGKWFRAPRAGAYGGDNWIRTGYYNNGGVVPYMVNKGYFKAVSKDKATLGSIISWNDKSHVAIVTAIENDTIKYSHHSNVKKSSVYYTLKSSDDTSIYAPKI